ncbi:hypothetical protein F0562_016230 [Nyssa sinensis]|uniref:MABP1/WDR62 second WD40 domain-containing protein n=1 Tax=Nyssa sinensis TaxID=561372 RepID=A0A5J4ZMS5_9ASTE|nr:hypothetical protein F0562_016230 [Nyssa sinensis]
MHSPSLACVARGCSGGVSFATCSADGTVRLWDLALQPVSSEDGPTLATDHNFLITEPVSTSCLVSAGIFERDSVESGVSTEGFRSMAVSSDGKHLAAGDCRGNLHIYNLHSSDYICFQDVHDAEILSLSFSDIFSEVSENHYFLASGGRDRMIRLYDVKRNFDLIGSIDDHSSAVYSVKLACNGCKILSCSADRSLVSRDVEITDTDFKVSRCHQMASQGAVYDMAVDRLMEVVVTVGQDKKINAFNITSGKLIRSLKHDGDSGDPIKVTMDPSCSYLVCSYSNRSICMYDFITGEMVARAVGHAEVITGVIFLPDCKHIVSVGGDGCIFVWKVPAPLSVRMLQRIKESLGPLSPITMARSPVALSQIMFHTKDDHLCKTNPKEVSVLKNSNQASQTLPCQRGCPQGTSAFKFSISRLPKWAQAKVTSSGIIPTNPEFTTSQQVGPEAFSPSVSYGGGYSPVCPEVQTPSKHELEGSEPIHGGMHIISSDTDNSQGSPMPRRSCSFAMDKRWLTIHTVCLDLLNSPEIWDMKDIKVPVSIPNLSEDPAMETSNINCIGASSRKFGVNNSSVEPTSGLGNNVVGVYNASACHEVVVREVTEHLQLDTTESRVQATVDVDASHMKSQYNDLFNLNSGNLSAKLKIEGRKSSTGRSYSARFVVRRDLLRGQNKLFDTPVRDFGSETMNWSEEAAPGTTLGDPSIQVLEESEKKDDCKQDPKNSTQNLLCLSRILSQSDSTENSVNKEVIQFRDQEESNSEGIEKQQTVIACKEALLNLDAAAENALQLFSKLGGMASIEEISRGPGAQLYDEVTQMLPSIAKKVHAVAKLLQPTNNSSGTTRVDVSSLEPLLGTFAESLSQRVVELLKKNCSSP